MPGLYYQRSLSRINSGLINHSELPNLTVRNSWNSSTDGLQLCAQTDLDSSLVKQRGEGWNRVRSAWMPKAGDVTHPKQLNLTFNVNANSCPIPYGAGIGSSESETDLAAMVHEFIENGGSHGFDLFEGSDSDHSSPNPARLRINLEVLTSSMSPLEKKVLTELKSILPLVYERIDLICFDQGNECKGGCVRRLIVNYLRSMGSDASISRVKWQSSGKVPGGEYEYLDVTFDKDCSNTKRLIVDLDFQSQFEIARPTQHYLSTLKLLPVVYIGSAENLDQILQVMSEAARCSLKQNSMYLPPWRTLAYMRAKWHSPCERLTDCLLSSTKNKAVSSHSQGLCVCSENNQCLELLRRIRTSLLCVAENDGTPVVYSHRRDLSFPRKKKLINQSCYSSYHEF